MQCCAYEKDERPSMADVCDWLYDLAMDDTALTGSMVPFALPSSSSSSPSTTAAAGAAAAGGGGGEKEIFALSEGRRSLVNLPRSPPSTNTYAPSNTSTNSGKSGSELTLFLGAVLDRALEEGVISEEQRHSIAELGTTLIHTSSNTRTSTPSERLVVRHRNACCRLLLVLVFHPSRCSG
mgnify:CR=1 FL=1